MYAIILAACGFCPLDEVAERRVYVEYRQPRAVRYYYRAPRVQVYVAPAEAEPAPVYREEVVVRERPVRTKVKIKRKSRGRSEIRIETNGPLPESIQLR